MNETLGLAVIETANIRYFMSDSLSTVWRHLVHCAKFSMLRFSKGNYAHSFHPISTKLYRKHVKYRETYRLLLFLANCQLIKIYGTLKISYFSYISIIHRANVGLSWQEVKQIAKVPGPLVQVYNNNIYM